MQITSVRLETVRWPIASGGAARDRTERVAIIVEVTTSDAIIGLGEAAPLPEYSFDSLEAARRDLALFASTAPFACEPTLAAAAVIAARAASASARFAIETALVDAMATAMQGSLADLLVDAPVSEMQIAVVVDTPEQADAAIEAGADCLKIKVGPMIDRQRVIDVVKIGADAGVSFRLDANRSWPRAGIHEILAQYSGAALFGSPAQRDPTHDTLAAFGYATRHGDDVEILVEEPCSEAYAIADALPLPVALDESLAMMTDTELEQALHSPAKPRLPSPLPKAASIRLSSPL